MTSLQNRQPTLLGMASSLLNVSLKRTPVLDREADRRDCQAQF
jgi:hypothetical protein